MSAGRGAAWAVGAVLATLCASRTVRAEVTVAGVLPVGCRGAAWFEGEAQRRGLKGRTTVAITREGGELVGKIWFLDGAGDDAREVRSPTCDAVAETLVLIAEVHERPSSGPMPSSAVLSVPPPPSSAATAPPPATPSALPAAPREPPPPLHQPRAEVPPGPTLRPSSFGVAFAADSAVVPGIAFGATIFGRFAPKASSLPTRGWATLSFGYLAGSTDVAGIHVAHRRWVGELGVVPYAWALPLGDDTRVGLALDASFAQLGVRADVPASRDDARPMLALGLGPRALTVLGPLSVEVGVDLVLPVSRRRFVLPEREEPVFRLPSAAFGGFLALGSR